MSRLAGAGRRLVPRTIPKVRRRTRARELSLQFLYTLEVQGDEARPDLPAFLAEAKAAVEVRALRS